MRRRTLGDSPDAELSRPYIDKPPIDAQKAHARPLRPSTLVALGRFRPFAARSRVFLDAIAHGAE